MGRQEFDSLTAHFHLTRRKSREISGSLMLIRCLSCETSAHFVSIVALNLKKLRILRLMRLECSSETLLIGLITRRSQVQVLSPQPQKFRNRMIPELFLGFFLVLVGSKIWVSALTQALTQTAKCPETTGEHRRGCRPLYSPLPSSPRW